jgi:hypothetical protein
MRSNAKSPTPPTMIAGTRAHPGSSARPTAKSKARHGQRHANGNGSSHDNGHGNAPSAAAVRTSRRSAAAAPAYNEGLHFDTPGLRYAVTDPVTPPPGTGAQVKLELSRRSDADLAAFAESNVTAMEGNPNFPTPTPPAPAFRTALTDFEDILAQLDILRSQTVNLTNQKNRVRANLENLFTQRGQYVQLVSNGDPDVIASAALPMRRPPTPVGQLPWPLSLEVNQSNAVGELLLKWAAVSGAKGYLLQCAEVVEGQARVWVNAYTGGKPTSAQKPLTPGKVYEFRVAALGGSTGQSDWSPVVSRMAA